VITEKSNSTAERPMTKLKPLRS